MPTSSSPSAIRRHTLDNGVSVVLLESRAAPVVALQVWVDVGAADENEAEGGIAHVHEHMLFKGTERRGVGQIASEVEGAGGDVNAWTSLDATVYHVVMASRHLETGLDVLSDAILHSSFDPDELSRELDVILEEIKRAEDSPQSRVSRALFSTAYAAHPYRRPVIGRSEVVRTFTREQILHFYKTHYRPDRLTVIAVGDFDSAHALEAVGRAFSGATGKAGELPPRASEPKQEEPRAAGLTDDVEETQLAVGWHGPGVKDEDLFAVDVMSIILGSGESSRLTHRIRHEQRLVNEIYAYAYTPRDAGVIVVGGSLHHDKLHETLRSIGDEVYRLKERPIAAEELQKAKAMLAADGVYQRETVEGLARRLGYWSTMVGDASFEDEYQRRVHLVTAEDVQRVARKYLVPESATVVALAPKGQEAAVETTALVKSLHEGLTPKLKSKPSHGAEVGLVKLSGGGRVVMVPDRTNPIVSVRCTWIGGLRSEGDDTAGFSNLTAEMLVRGTDRMSASELARNVDAMAGHMEGFGGRNSIGVRATFLTERFDEGMSLLGQCLTMPSFDESELDRTRTLVLEDLRSRADNPAGLAFDLFNKSLWDHHPYRQDVLGTPETVKQVTPEGLRGFYSSLVTREDAVISVVGDMDVGWTLELLEETLARLPTDGAPRKAAPEVEPHLTSPRTARLLRDRAQAHLVMGYRGLSLDDKDRYPLEVLCSVLSGQGGRLFLELRDKQSLCYTVSAFSIEGLEPGSFTVYMGTSPDKVGRALEGIEGLLGDVCAKGITEEELSRAQRYLVGTHDIGLQRLGARSATMALNELYGLGWDSHLRYGERIEAVTLDDVRSVAQRIMKPEGRVLAIVGPEGTGGPEANWKPAGAREV